MLPEKSTEEILKEADSYPVATFGDILRALMEHPEWLVELRKLILTEELLELPKKFDELLRRVERLEQDVAGLKQDVAELKQDVAGLKQDVAELKQDVAELKEDVAILKQDVEVLKTQVATLREDVDYLKGEFGRFKGKDFERTVRERYFAYFGRLLRKSRLIPFEEVLPLVEDAEDKGIISEDEADQLLRLDLILEGMIKKTGKPVVLAIESSFSLFPDDLQRALRRAQILNLLLKKETIPTVVGVEIRDEILLEAEEKGVLVVKVDY